jgi:hypothetical protein
MPTLPSGNEAFLRELHYSAKYRVELSVAARPLLLPGSGEGGIRTHEAG